MLETIVKLKKSCVVDTKSNRKLFYNNVKVRALKLGIHKILIINGWLLALFFFLQVVCEVF